jgi:hypothetical protein
MVSCGCSDGSARRLADSFRDRITDQTNGLVIEAEAMALRPSRLVRFLRLARR